MTMYLLVHEHRHGTDPYLFQSEFTLDDLNRNILQVCEILLVDFDEEHEEEVTIMEVGNEIATVTLKIR